MKSIQRRYLGRGRSAGLHACAAALALFSMAGPLQAVERQVIHSYVQGVTSQLTPLRPMNTATRLHLALGIPLREPEALTRTLKDLYNPQSPRYQQWMTPQEVTAKFCATEQDYKAIVSWAASKGFQVTATHPNRICVEVEGTVGDIQKAFNITLQEYSHPDGTRTFFAPNTNPTVDSPIPLATIDGLDNYELAKPNSRLKTVAPTSAPAKGGGITPNDGGNSPNLGSAPGGAYAACDFRAAYVPGSLLRGLGQNVGLLQYDDYYDVDISNYETQFGLPGTYPQRVVVNGPMPAPGSGQGEVCLDIEMVLSMAPGVANIYVYEAPNTLANWVPLLSRIQSDNLCQQVSCSWSGGADNATGENIFQMMAAQGMSFFNATGDQDAFLGFIPFPSMSANITECGGTTLSTTGPCGTYVSETVWNWGGGTGSSGGWTNVFGIPWWQQGIDMTANLGSTVYRNVPDVALTGDNVYVRYNNGGAGVFGGTSCAAPLWAGFTALVNEQAAKTFRPGLGFLNPAIYAVSKGATYTANFHDITTGNNQKPGSGSLYSATTGYDLCTGWGTPAGQGLINYLSGGFPSVPNGGFEVGDFSFWLQSGNTGFTSVSGGAAHSGNYGGSFGPVGSLGYIYQQLATVPGQVYLLDFWVSNSGDTNNEFYVYCNSTLLDLVNPVHFGWTHYQFVVPATWTATFVEFGFRNDPGYFDLDDVTFTPLPGNTGVVPGLPVNGGFETGNTANWGVGSGIYPVSALSFPQGVHSGTNAVEIGTVGADGALTQTIPTVPGQTYLLQFWMAHLSSATPVNDFNLYWNGNNIYNFTNAGSFSYQDFGLYVTATSSSTVLTIAGRNDPDWFYIDDITLTPLISSQLGQAAYVRSQNGEPWALNDNLNAMNTVFGPGAWNLGMFETVDPAVLFSPSVHLAYLDGSDSGAVALNNFLNANQALIRSWVSNGGNLVLNCAPNGWTGNMGFPFGVTLNYGNFFNGVASVVNPEHPIVQGPFQPVATSYTGSYFGHAVVTGAGLIPVINGTNGTILAEMNIGQGHAMFGGMTLPYFHQPQPQAQNLLANILAYANVGTQGTFDDLPYPGTGIPVPVGYRGVTWNNFYYVDSTQLPSSGYVPGAVSPLNCAYNSFGNPASITSAKPFNFLSAWVTAAWRDNLSLEVKGLANGVLVYDQTYSPSATTPTLLTFDMRNVTEVDFISSGGTPHAGYSGSGAQFVLDNVSLSLAAAQPAGVDHFAVSGVPSPQCVNAAFPVTLTAQDPVNNLVSAFTAPVTVSGWSGVGSLIEGFESGTWPQAPWVASAGTPGVIGAAFAHDGSYGLQDPDWAYRTDVSIGNGADVVSMWVRPTSATAGRAYLAFGASAAGAWSAVVAPNASQFIIQQNSGYSFSDKVSASQTYVAGKWYKVTVYFDSPTEVTAKLFDSDGKTVLNSLTYNGVTGLPGGVAMRSFGNFSLDTIRGGALNPVSITPNLANLAAGTWSGNVTVFQPANEMVLFANSGFGGPGGVSNPFRVNLDPPLLGPVTRIPGGVSLSWSTCPGGVYQVQYTTSLNLPITWLNLGAPITAGGNSLSINDTFSGPMRFYKIVMLP